MRYSDIKRLFILSFTILLLSACSDKAPDRLPVTISGLTMGTTYTVKLSDTLSGDAIERLRSGIDLCLDEINKKMSTYLDDSELSLINHSRSTGWVPISGELYEVLDASLKVSAMTLGAFDITVGPVVNLWGFGPEGRPERVPSAEQIQQRQRLVGYAMLSLQPSPPAVKKEKSEIYMDLSGIAKGYGVDKVAELLEHEGFWNYMVEIGGEIKARGVNAGGKNWRIGIERPVSSQRMVQRIIGLDNAGMATSGDYRNYFEEDEIRYSHTIDPESGRPITHKLASVTVLHPSTTIADALATGLLVLGPKRGYEIAIEENLAALFIIGTGDGFEEKVTPAFLPNLVDN